MTDIADIEPAWLTHHPLPVHDAGTDKNSRGRVLLVGGAEFVPGALRLTGEAALRAGAGKLQMATVSAAATALGVLVPEAAMIALPADAEGEIAPAATDRLLHLLDHCDTLVAGPGMGVTRRTAELVAGLLARPRDGLTVLLDAGAISCAGDLADVIRAHRGRVVMTPHHGEMAALLEREIEQVAADPVAAARQAATRFGATIVLKADRTVIASHDGGLLRYGSDCVGLATGGSGDVLAGIISGLLARGASPSVASGWGVWLHGEAGRECAQSLGPIGFLARDLVGHIPRLMYEH